VHRRGQSDYFAAAVISRQANFVAPRLDGMDNCAQKPDRPGNSIREIAPEGGLLMADVTIEARPNGPYVVTGTIELHDTNGNVIATQARTVLCRCGASTKKPFCDGTHSKIGFQAAAQAVPESAEKA
jgi:CDGSH-type Zn-finger protein